MLNPEYCFECQRIFPNDKQKWDKTEVECSCGSPCCTKHWLNRGAHAKVNEYGMCSNCDYQSYLSAYGGM